MKPTRKQIEQARRLTSDPGWQTAFFLHRILSHCYRGQKEFRLQAYRDAGIPKLLRDAERRASQEKS